MQSACAAVAEAQAIAQSGAQALKADSSQLCDQRARYTVLATQHEAVLADVAQKEARIQQLLRDLQTMVSEHICNYQMIVL